MDVQIKTRDVKLTDGLQEFIDAQMRKLERIEEPLIDAKLELRSEHFRSGGPRTIAQFTIQTKRAILRTEESNHDPHIAIDQAVERMARQIRRFRDKKITKPRRKSQALSDRQALGSDLTDAIEEADEELGVDDLPAPVRHKRFTVLPMDEAEAIEQMELLGHDFFVFFNPDDGQINVMYRRHDGQYGVIQPELK